MHPRQQLKGELLMVVVTLLVCSACFIKKSRPRLEAASLGLRE